jgi:hypothetical protein
MWAADHETRDEITGFYRRAWEHSDATISMLPIDAPGHVPWWPRPDVKLFNLMVHVLTETSRHAGHADILREQLDGATGTAAGDPSPQAGPAFWEQRCATIEQAAQAAAASFQDAAGLNQLRPGWWRRSRARPRPAFPLTRRG